MNLNMLYETVRQALKNIASNKFRTLLTMLGIIIGIMAVMIIVGLGNGLTESMRASVSSMGMNLLQVNVFGPRARNVDIDEMYASLKAAGPVLGHFAHRQHGPHQFGGQGGDQEFQPDHRHRRQ